MKLTHEDKNVESILNMLYKIRQWKAAWNRFELTGKDKPLSVEPFAELLGETYQVSLKEDVDESTIFKTFLSNLVKEIKMDLVELPDIKGCMGIVTNKNVELLLSTIYELEGLQFYIMGKKVTIKVD